MRLTLFDAFLLTLGICIVVLSGCANSPTTTTERNVNIYPAEGTKHLYIDVGYTQNSETTIEVEADAKQEGVLDLPTGVLP